MFVFHADGTMLQSNPDAGDPLTSDSNGLAGVLDLAHSLEVEGRTAERMRVLELAANAFADSPQALELRQLLR